MPLLYCDFCTAFQRSLDGEEAMETAESREEYRYKAVCIVEETPETSTCLEMPLFGHAKHNIESREVEYTISFLDYKLVIPPHATRGGKDIPFQTGEMPYGPVGPFKFPPNTKPVSSVVWFCSDQMSDLEKPIKIVLSHCLKSPNEDSLKNLAFVKACDKVSTQNRDKEFKFHIVTDEERDEEPLFTANDGTLVTRHACFFCIVEEVAREDIDHASYCLTEAFSHRATGGVYEIRFILSYYLSPCLKVRHDFCWCTAGFYDFILHRHSAISMVRVTNLHTMKSHLPAKGPIQASNSHFQENYQMDGQW